MGAFVFLKKADFAFAPGTRVIPAQRYAEFIEAGKLLEAARQEADRLVAAGREAAEAARLQGYEEGVAAARQDTARENVETVARRVEYLANIEDKLVSILLGALDQILGEMDQRDVVTRIIGNALRVLRGQTAVTIRVSPDNSAAVAEQLEALRKEFPEMTILQVRSDPALSGTSCILESDVGVVDASLDVQVAAIREAFTRHFKTPARSE